MLIRMLFYAEFLLFVETSYRSMPYSSEFGRIVIGLCMQIG